MIFFKKNIFFKCLFFTTILVSGSSCREKEKPVPIGILSEKKMVEILVGLNITEAIISSKTDKNVRFKFNVFNECKVSSSDYEKSLKYYCDNPERLKKIYQMAIDSVNRISK